MNFRNGYKNLLFKQIKQKMCKTIKDIRQAIKSIDNQENKITDYEISKFISKVEKISTFGFLDELGVSNHIKNAKQKNKNVQNIFKILKQYVLQKYVRTY